MAAAARSAGLASGPAHTAIRARAPEVIVGVELKAGEPILDRVAGGQENDWQITSGAQFSRELEPVPAGKQHVEQGQIGDPSKDQVRARLVGKRR